MCSSEASRNVGKIEIYALLLFIIIIIVIIIIIIINCIMTIYYCYYISSNKRTGCLNFETVNCGAY